MYPSLPDKASVEHLKKQAKALLRAARSGAPAARGRFVAAHPNYASSDRDAATAALQEAQHVIAREYGHASWPALVASLQLNSDAETEPDSDRLLYTNGGKAIELLDAAKVPGEKLEWIEALQDGPVPLVETLDELNAIRARHMAWLGWTSEEGALRRFAQRDAPLLEANRYGTLELWFEHDLYDQLQLMQILDRLAGLPDWNDRVVLYQFDEFIGRLTPETLQSRRPAAQRVSPDQRELGRRAWNAFRESETRALPVFLESDTSALPFLDGALRRLLEERPAKDDGLGHTERHVLETLREGPVAPMRLFRQCQAREAAAFMGDASFFAILQRLARGESPLIETTSGQRFQTPIELGYTEAFREQRIQLTITGRLVLGREAHWLEFLQEPYWIGGCKFAPRSAS